MARWYHDARPDIITRATIHPPADVSPATADMLAALQRMHDTYALTADAYLTMAREIIVRDEVNHPYCRQHDIYDCPYAHGRMS